ncbi:MAG TPA: segregation/condensation protein A, partial [bacterium]|nr:segregation/condensation protein A [bacterium]
MDEQDLKSDWGGFDPLQVNLPYFDGPLDLLLHLVRKQQLNINEVRLVDLTEPYLVYLERIQQLNLDQAGEFLTIAATLIWLKSRSLLPPSTQEPDEPDPETVEELLLLRLQDYQRIKDAAAQLERRDLLGRDVFPRPGERDEAPVPTLAQAFEEVSLFSLLEAFRAVLERSQASPGLNVLPERNRIEDKIDEMVASLYSRRELYFEQLFLPDSTRVEVILTFLALLELTRLRALVVVQAQAGGPILCRVTQAFLDRGSDWKQLVL